MGFIFVRKSTMDKTVEELEARIASLERIKDADTELIDVLINSDEKCRARDEAAYNSLVNILNNKKATKADITAAMEEAIGYLGENLEG